MFLNYRYPAFVIAVALLVAACGGDSGESDGTQDQPESTTAATSSSMTTQETTTTAATTTTSTTSTTTTTTEPPFSINDLTERQFEQVDYVCRTSTAGEPYGGDASLLINQILTGELGVPQFEEALAALGDFDDPGAAVDSLYVDFPVICADIGWSPDMSPTTTTTVDALATVDIAIGELTVTGQTEGCPPSEILAGEYWVGPNRDVWTDQDGEEWMVSLSVDAAEGQADLKWSFSVSGGDGHRLISYHENESDFTADIGPRFAVMATTFSDSLASVSGGWPDTAGTVTIDCDS